MNELVIIGQQLDKVGIIDDLEKCLLTSNEIIEYKNENSFNDPFPVEI